MVRTSIFIDGKRLSDHDFSRATLQQRIGGHHSCELRLKQDPKKGVLAQKVESWIGTPISLGFDFQEDAKLSSSPVEESFRGIITSINLSRQRGTTEIVVIAQSPTIIFDDGLFTRSFSDKGLQEVVDEVLGPYKSSLEPSPQINPKFSKTIPYIVQYKESNYSFLERLSSQFGEWFYYDGLNIFFGKPANIDNTPLNLDERGINHFSISVQVNASKFGMTGYNYEKHEYFEEKSPGSSSVNAVGDRALELGKSKVFRHSHLIPASTTLDKDELSFLVNRREEIIVDEVAVLRGSGSNPRLKLGSSVEVKDNELGENYGKFSIIGLIHDISQSGDYYNHFEAIPAEVATPPLTAMPEPPFCETQLARVTDVNDTENEHNSLGRVRVKFLWQEGTEEKSPWIRVASPYTGKDKGFYIVPEVDDQVLVAFENNHPDKPYVLTGMYNGEAKPEWFDDKNRYKGFKSGGGNKWKFDDKEQEIQVHAPRSILMTAGEIIAIRSGPKGDDSSIVMKKGKEITIKTNGDPDSVINIDAGQGTVNIKAQTVNVRGAALVDVKGGFIKLNS